MLKIIQLNCRGFHNNRHLITQVLLAEDPDVILLNHTGIVPPTHSIRIYGYTTRSSPSTPYDGVAILTKTHLKHEFLTSWLSPSFLAVKIFTQSQPLLIATAYARPNAGIPYADINRLFNNTNLPVYLIGDLNATHTDFHHTVNNAHGNQLHPITTLKRLRFLGPDFPTCFTARGAGRPDLALTNRSSLHLHHHLSPGQLCGSDHIPVILRISTNPIAIPSTPFFSYAKANWEAFGAALEGTHTQMPLENRHHTTLDTFLDTIQTDILRAANDHIPKSHHKIYRDFRPSIRTQRLLTCYQHRFNRNRHQHTRIQRDLNTLRQHILNSLQTDHNNHWTRLINNTETHRGTNPHFFWKQINRFRGTTTTPFEYLNINNTKITDPPAVTEAFKEHWEQVFHPHPPPPHPPSTTHINAVTDHMHQTQQQTQPLDLIDTNTLNAEHLLTTPFEEEDVKRLLQRTRRRAPGASGISWAMARHLPPRIISSLTRVYNACLATGYFPLAFKSATTILIPKPGKDPHLPGNYRPISLLELIGKTFEKLINARLRLHLDGGNFLSYKQFGFRQFHSTEDALNVITAYLRTNTPHFKSALVTKDVKQAFDTVWHTGLKYKICTKFDLPPLTQRLLCNFLTDRRMRIRHQRCFSDLFTPLAGVPQGSSLSPTLFNMYTSDLPDPSHPESLTIQYADDVTQLTRARQLDTLTNRLQTELTATSLWELKWRIQAHPDKTKVTYFNIKSDTPRHLYLYPFLPNPAPIPHSRTNTVLGLVVDKDLRFHFHARGKVAQARLTQSSLYRFRDSHPKTKLHLYKALVLPLLTYCPLALSLTARTHQLSLQIIQNKALRFALDVKWFEFKSNQSLHEEAKILPINMVLHHRILKRLRHFRMVHIHHHDFIANLPPHRRGARPINLLDPDAHALPEPLLTR